jgi:hydrogenase expression/formation protein HypD
VRFVDEYRNPVVARQHIAAIARAMTRPWTLMEVCGGQTHAIVRYGLQELLPAELTLIHGPGCPVCVTPEVRLNQAFGLARLPGVRLCTFGDMLRVPTDEGDLASARAAGANVMAVYSPLDALAYAELHRAEQVVFFAVGFETTAPATAQAILLAERKQLTNFSVLASHVRVPPALTHIFSSPHSKIHGLLAAGHVCAIMGLSEYQDLSQRFRVPIVATGFEPIDILRGILRCVEQLESNTYLTENQYERAVLADGNPAARKALLQVFEPVTMAWRGLGLLALGGLALRPEYGSFDAERRFSLPPEAAARPTRCQSALVLQGQIRPPQCSEFGKTCTPASPLGAPMVSDEGACAAYYRYRPTNRLHD